MQNGKLNAADKTFWIRDTYSSVVIRDIQKYNRTRFKRLFAPLAPKIRESKYAPLKIS